MPPTTSVTQCSSSAWCFSASSSCPSRWPGSSRDSRQHTGPRAVVPGRGTDEAASLKRHCDDRHTSGTAQALPGPSSGSGRRRRRCPAGARDASPSTPSGLARSTCTSLTALRPRGQPVQLVRGGVDPVVFGEDVEAVLHELSRQPQPDAGGRSSDDGEWVVSGARSSHHVSYPAPGVTCTRAAGPRTGWSGTTRSGTVAGAGPPP